MSATTRPTGEGNARAGALRGLGILGSFAVPSTVVVLALFVMISVQRGVEAGVVSLSLVLPVGYAFGAGMVASVNPCGFFLLPAYMSYQLGVDEEGFYESSSVRRLLRALALGGTATIGFVILFGSVGAVLSLGGTGLVSVFPYAGVVIGAGMTAFGLWLVISRTSLSFAMPGAVTVTPSRNRRNVFLWGIAYALGSLCCTLPIFLVVVFSGLATGDWTRSFGQFVGYALGMGVVLVAVTVGAALFRGGVARWLEGAMPYVHRTSSFFMVGAGVYILYYWLIYADFFF
jgi:cytochrome c biogenesis protein CcdA